jgi:prevent-host-death family protein
MRTANIAELKNNLSNYLLDVKRGEEVLISDRNVPIAKIVPLKNSDDFSSEELALASAGVLRLPDEKGLGDKFWKETRADLSSKVAIDAILEERDEY